MCGRYTLKTPPGEWGEWLLPMTDLGAISDDWHPRYNIAPTQSIVAIAGDGEERRVAGWYRWGLLPSWADNLGIGSRMINARSETVLEKRSFATAMKERRCLIVADGYYEWCQLTAGPKQAYWIRPLDHGVFYFAGLWETNRKATAGTVTSCTIITTAAGGGLSRIHDRMPVILRGFEAEQWLDPALDSNAAHALLGPLNEDQLELRKVSSYVNNPRHEDEKCLVQEPE